MNLVMFQSGRRIAASAIAALTLCLSFSVASAQTATNIQVSSTVVQSSVKRFGVNLADQTFYDSGQMLKNLVFQNPGFEPEKYRSIMICNAVTANTCTDDNNYSPQPTGFWTGGTYKILSGNSAGKTGTIVSSTMNPSSCSGCGQIIQFDQSVNAAVGDYFVLTNNFPGNGDAGWWDSTSGGGTITSETSDLSPETPGTQAVVLNATPSGAYAAVTQYWDSDQGLSFIQMNGNFAVTFRAKGVGGSNTMSVNVERLGGASVLQYLQQTVTLTNSWQDYTLTFSANETGSTDGTAQLVFGVSGASVELDDVSLAQTNSSASNPTAFRDDVVNALEELKPGSIRMMAGDGALGSDLINQIQVPFARYREGWSTGGTSTATIAYGIHEFLQLCQQVGADPWITIPTATTPAEMQAFIEYLTGTGSDQYSALRISRGQSTPWTSVFNKIHLELGNETWNGSFRGESMNYDAYPAYANQIFGVARATTGYQASKFDLVLDGFTSSGYDQVLLATSTQHDSIDMAPYLLFSANNEAMSTMYGALFAEPEMWMNPGGNLANVMSVAKAAPTPTNLHVYETNLGTMEGAITQTQLNSLTPSIGAGIGHAVHMLEMMRMGVQYQNAFALPQYEFLRSDGSLAKLWGIVLDMGTTNRRRPQFLTQSMANAVIGGNMVQTVQTGANPTWNQPLSSDSVQLNGAHYLQSFAFQNGSTTSIIIFNLNLTTALPVTFSGANAPSGSVQMTQITSANITDNNETSLVVQPATQTLSGFNPATGISLPPFSMTVLTAAGTTVAAPVFSVAAGTYTSSQSVSITDSTSGAAIYYTTDGSTPTTASNVYSGAITVSSSETLNAIATASSLSPSTVTSAAYVINSAPATAKAATPTFSVAGGSYSAAQTVSIADATSGATIYYTTTGTVPTTSSTKYTGAITVSASETLEAIAVATNYTNSAVASAAYTITKPTAATPTFSVAAGTYSAAQTVSIADSTSGATIYYTTTGTTPTTSSTKYTGPITVSASETLEAIAVVTNDTNSAVASASYTISKSTAATPTFSVAAGTYSAAQTVSIADATSGATIYYTTTGTTPTTSSTKYTGAITVSASEKLEAIAVATNYTNSAVASASYTIQTAAVATPVFSLAAGTYSGAQKVSITDATKGASIYYEINGSTTPVLYTGPLTVSATETIAAAALSTSDQKSTTITVTYTISAAKTAAIPKFSLAAGTYYGAQTVTMSDATAGATIYYTTNNQGATTSSTKYTGPIKLSSTEVLKAVAAAPNMATSTELQAIYTIETAAATPAFSVAGGTYTTAQSVSLTSATPGASVYYTTNGATPTTSSTKYSGAIKVSATQTIKAIAVATNLTNSAMGQAAYTINSSTAAVASPTFSLASGTYSGKQKLTLTEATPGTTLYYQINGTGTAVQYTGPLTVSTTEFVNATAISNKTYQKSVMVTAKYTIK